MASIYGFKLKKVKTFPGRDWEGITADLWYNDKKVAQYADYGDGAGGTLEYYEFKQGQEEYQPILDKAIKRFVEDERFNAESRETLRNSDYFMGEDIFIDELLQLTDNEKHFKKILKEGFTCIAFYQEVDGKSYAMWLKTKDDTQIERIKNKQGIKNFHLYTSIDEFDIK